MYLVENYFDDQACPDPDMLELKLKVAGFDDEDINDALNWLAGQDDAAGAELPPEFALRATFRSYSVREEARLSRETRGFLVFQESSGVIDALMREGITECAPALPDGLVDVERLKI